MNTLNPFAATMLSVVLGCLLLVMTVAFISIPLTIGAHPGEGTHRVVAGDYHPS